MARLHSRQGHPWSMPWPDYDGQSMHQAPFEGIYSHLLLLTCLLGLITFGTGPLTNSDAIEFYQFRFLTKLGNMYPYASTYNSLATIGAGVHLSWDQVQPWPNSFQGRLGWYRQGLHEVAQNRLLIQSLETKGVPTILLAASIANQGNAPTRPFGADLPERLQQWLGDHCDWPLPQWQWAKTEWDADFKQYSVGIAQIRPDEVEQFGYDLAKIDLFDPTTSIKLMNIKMARTIDAAAPFGLNKTDWFILVALGNNEGPSVIANYMTSGHDMQSFLANDFRLRRQLARMMTYSDYLHSYENWPWPEGVNRDHIWWLIRKTNAGS